MRPLWYITKRYTWFLLLWCFYCIITNELRPKVVGVQRAYAQRISSGLDGQKWLKELVLKLRVEKQVETFTEHLHARFGLPSLRDTVPSGQLIICPDLFLEILPVSRSWKSEHLLFPNIFVPGIPAIIWVPPIRSSYLTFELGLEYVGETCWTWDLLEQ